MVESGRSRCTWAAATVWSLAYFISQVARSVNSVERSLSSAQDFAVIAMPKACPAIRCGRPAPFHW